VNVLYFKWFVWLYYTMLGQTKGKKKLNNNVLIKKSWLDDPMAVLN